MTSFSPVKSSHSVRFNIEHSEPLKSRLSVANELNMCGIYLIIFLLTVHRTGITFIISLDVDTTLHHTTPQETLQQANKRKGAQTDEKNKLEVSQHLLLLQSSLIRDYCSRLLS